VLPGIASAIRRTARTIGVSVVADVFYDPLDAGWRLGRVHSRRTQAARDCDRD
jgi:hypothetical protein